MTLQKKKNFCPKFLNLKYGSFINLHSFEIILIQTEGEIKMFSQLELAEKAYR